jgi:hypothetical protein
MDCGKENIWKEDDVTSKEYLKIHLMKAIKTSVKFSYLRIILFVHVWVPMFLYLKSESHQASNI